MSAVDALPDLLPGFCMLRESSGMRSWFRPELIDAITEEPGGGVLLHVGGLELVLGPEENAQLAEAIRVAWQIRDREPGAREVKHYLASELSPPKPRF